KTLDPPIKYVYNPSLAKGAQKVLKNGRPGYVVDTFRTRKQDGKIVSVEKISRDHYTPQPTIIAVNRPVNGQSTKQQAPKKQIIEDGVSAPLFSGEEWPEM